MKQISGVFRILKTFVKFKKNLILYNQKKINVVHRTRISDVMIFGSHVVQEVTEAARMHHITVYAAHLTARIQVSSPAKELGWLKIVKQFAIHAQVSLLSNIFRDFCRN